MQVVWEYLVHEENENRCLDKGDTLQFTIAEFSPLSMPPHPQT